MAKNINQCKGCGAELSYSPEKGGLVCSHCANFIDLPLNDITITKKELSNMANPEELTNQEVQFLCPTCGRIHMNSFSEETSKCPYCGNENTQKKSNFKYVQDGIVPLRITREDATSKFKAWIKKQPFAPSDLKKQAKVGNLSAYYSPAWVYDFDVETTYSGVGVRTSTNSKGEHVRTYHNFSGKRRTQYKDHIQFADFYSARHIEDCLGYFGTQELPAFDDRYTYGHEVKDVKLDVQTCWKHTITDVNKIEAESIKKQLGYDSYSSFKSSGFYTNPRYALYYLPVYEVNYDYKGKLYSCYINGYSGKLDGVAPKSPIKIALCVLGLVAFVALLIVAAMLT